ncbi:hypothetical protein [Ochrobactrum sp. Marseille-Q0166]|uniref:hypothetical protein n=1 Tax=Ochrobactrum sp. Marseille-Q0166 TaxID=2761105 RepID=UPI001655689A|nr:hypothetical protein [Ochrobactrum sp. Marseille-Q0166]MBC8716214.1 hypothetical protein [Ochrobactrum sp. Marseille-Q0166]
MDKYAYSSVVNEYFLHVRILTGVFVSLCMSRILASLTRYIQFKRKYKPNFLHIVWLITCSLFVVDWWWDVLNWNYGIKYSYASYVFIVLYAFSFYFLSALIAPDNYDEYKDFYNYFKIIRFWFYGIFILNQISYDLLHCYICEVSNYYIINFVFTSLMAVVILISIIMNRLRWDIIASVSILFLQIILNLDEFWLSILNMDSLKFL